MVPLSTSREVFQTVLKLSDPAAEKVAQTGGKGSRLAIMHRQGFPVLPGLVVTAEAYRLALATNGLRQRIAAEFSRKPLPDMRWEELWDASLRIRNSFLRTPLPPSLRDAILMNTKSLIGAGPLVVRSSALHEDAEAGSCAGLHDSFLNITGDECLLEHIQLVWASLWSSSALSYAREIGLQVPTSAMAVVIQPFLPGAVSGVAFAVAPGRPDTAMIEAVPGLNQGLVDGEVAPDRYYITIGQGVPLTFQPAARDQICVPEASGGVRLVQPDDKEHRELLSQDDLAVLASFLTKLSEVFKAPQDIEWTMNENGMTLLQSRPITGMTPEVGTRRAFDLTLRRSFTQLQSLRDLILNHHLPAMARDAESLAKPTPEDLSDLDLAAFLRDGTERITEWEQIYWRDFIPFVHGARLFGEIYNTRCKPADPYEFVRLLQPETLESVNRNRALLELAHRRAHNRSNPDPLAAVEIERELGLWLSTWTEEVPEDSEGARRDCVEHLLDRLERIPLPEAMQADAPLVTSPETSHLVQVFLEGFPAESRDEARNLLELGRLSYRLRDDDNIHLAAVRRPVARALAEARRRLSRRNPEVPLPEDPEEIISLLEGTEGSKLPMRASPLPGSGFIPPIHPFGRKTPSGVPSPDKGSLPQGIRLRQIRGQPANQGFARGKARIVCDRNDLFSLERGEILVVDSLSPEMTMVVPLASAILERRGGMLIHGAIIAREYGIPCVTGLTGILEAVTTGDLLTVDGHFGLVTVDRPEDQRTAGIRD